MLRSIFLIPIFIILPFLSSCTTNPGKTVAIPQNQNIHTDTPVSVTPKANQKIPMQQKRAGRVNARTAAS